jgi:Family of unknown function (DUF5302)
MAHPASSGRTGDFTAPTRLHNAVRVLCQAVHMADSDSNPPAPSEDNDTKRKFREAMQRKQAHHSQRENAAEERDGSSIHGAHGPAAAKRSFRRKSG